MQLRIDGLTPRVLHQAPRSWWEDAFTRRLLDLIPLDTRQVVELDCGLAAAAHLLLPSLPEASYLGLGLDPTLVEEARHQLRQTPLALRSEVRLGAMDSLPVGDESCDLVLSVMSLMNHPDVPAVLAEARRVLRPGGRLVAAEPDNLGQRFYFDGVLEEISAAFHALCLRARVARQPADIALGPRLSSLMREAGLQRMEVLLHMVHNSREESAADFFGRLERIAAALAVEAGLEPDDPLVASCQQAARRGLFAGMPRRVGFSCHLVPVFLCAGRFL